MAAHREPTEALRTLYDLLVTAPEVEDLLGEIAVLACGVVDPAVSSGVTGPP